jgi:hypothetical protein
MLSALPPPYGADFSISADILIMLGFIAAAMLIACLRFSQAPVLERLARTLSTARRN